MRSPPERDVARLQRHAEVMPCGCAWPFVEQARNAADDLAELGVRHGPDEDAAVVVAVAFGPLPQQRDEVARVSADEDPSLPGSERENLRIGEPAQMPGGD